MEPRPVMRKKTEVRTLFVFLLVAALAAALPAAAVLAFGPAVPDNLRGPLRVESISYAPADPAPLEEVTVTVEVGGTAAGPMTVNLQFAAYFATTAAGGGPMTPVGPRTFQSTIPGFEPGTEVWMVAGIVPSFGRPVLSDPAFLQVGEVVRDGPSQLRIGTVTHTVEQGWRDAEVTIEATVTSRSPVTHVDVAYMAFCSQRSMPVDPPMSPIAPTTYSITISIPPPCTVNMNTILLYAVVVQDASGNTAVSDVGVVDFTEMAPQALR